MTVKSDIQPNSNRDVQRDRVKLPKIEMKLFTGDQTSWSNFKKFFKVNIHNKKHLTAMEKFTYLISFLDKSALQAVVQLFP